MTAEHEEAAAQLRAQVTRLTSQLNTTAQERNLLATRLQQLRRDTPPHNARLPEHAVRLPSTTAAAGGGGGDGNSSAKGHGQVLGGAQPQWRGDAALEAEVDHLLQQLLHS